MNTKGKIKSVTIPIDFSKTIGKPDEKDVVLLYDEASNCYYRASLAHVIGSALKAVEQRHEEIKRELAIEKEKNEAFKADLLKRQNQFISDINEINKTIIDLVEGGTKK